MPILVVRIPFGRLSEAAPPGLDAAQGPKRKLLRRARVLRTAWVLFLVIGVPLGFMAALGPLAYSGIYMEPLRQFWQPWPPDILKGIGSALGFAATLGYLLYRKGRYPGYRSGAIAERATSRNRAEGRVTVANPIAAARWPSQGFGGGGDLRRLLMRTTASTATTAMRMAARTE